MDIPMERMLRTVPDEERIWRQRMNDMEKNKDQLVREIEEMRRLNQELQTAQTACRLAEDALRASEMKFRAVAHSAIDAIIGVDSDDTVVFWNQGARNIFRYTEEEILGKSVTILIPERFREAHRSGVARYLETGVPHIIGRTVELEGLRKGGIEFPIELSLSTWRTSHGVFFSGVIRDISYRKRVEGQLKQRTAEVAQRNEELESLIQMVAHDLKSPVITIAGLVRHLREKAGAGLCETRSQQILEQLGSSAESMERFLKDLLDELSQSYTPPPAEPVRMDNLVNEIIGRHTGKAMERGISLEADLPEEVPPVLADARRILQVLDNLVINAIRHMGNVPNAKVRIRVAGDEGDLVVVSVSDNGVGIPPEYHGRIFDRFFRVSTGSEVKTGTGLGLAIVKKIVESHRGRVWVESEVGKGTTFSFTLPRARG